MVVELELCDVGVNSQIEEIWVILHRRNEVECASHKISDDDSHENEPEYSVDVLHDLLEHYFLRSSLSAENSLDH